MSGGSYDYVYHRIDDLADAIRASVEREDASASEPPRCWDHAAKRWMSLEESAVRLQRVREARLQFAALLNRVAKAAHDIEWVDSADYGPGDELAAIEAALAPETAVSMAAPGSEGA